MKPHLHLAPTLALSLLGLAGSCASPQGPPMSEIAPEINGTLFEEARTVIVPGDVLTVRAVTLIALEQRDLDVQVTVQPDGDVVLPGLGTVEVAGRTPGQVTELLEEALAPDLASGAKVAVNIAEPAPRTVHVLGAVGKSGLFPIPPDRHLTLVEVLAEAGGIEWLTSYLGNTLLVRWDAAEQRQVSWVVDARTRWWDEERTILLQPNDVVYVPDTPIVKVNTWIERYIIRNIPFPRFIIPAGG